MTKVVLLSAALFALRSMQHVLDSASFGHNLPIAPDGHLSGWLLSGVDWVPQLLSDKVILTPPYPGHKHAALWANLRVTNAEWLVDFEFRASGPEHAGGNLQIWYTKENQVQIGSSSIYTVGTFQGLALVIDPAGGPVGGIRAFLNDGTHSYRTHHNVEQLAFAHCDYSYRNLGRPSKLQMRQDSGGFEVLIDGRRCFRADDVFLPGGNYFGITAATSENPDSFEIFKFVTSTSASHAQEQPVKEGDATQHPIQGTPQGGAAAQAPAAQAPADISALVKRIDAIGGAVDHMSSQIKGAVDQMSSQVKGAVDGLAQSGATREHNRQLELKLDQITAKMDRLEQSLDRLRQSQKDYTTHFDKIGKGMDERHEDLLSSLPDHVGHALTTRGPNLKLFVFFVVAAQLVTLGGYVLYKRRTKGASKKYL